MTDLVPAVPALVQSPAQADTDAQVIELWLHGRSLNTRLAYENDIARFFNFVGKSIREITLRDFQFFGDSIEGSVSTKRRVIAATKSLFSFALKLGYVRFSVAAAVRAPKAMDRLAERILPEAKIHQMIALTPDGRDRMLLRCLYATGARVSEICAVKWQHVQANGDSGQITLFGKGGKTHAVVLPPSLWNDLVAFRADASDNLPGLRIPQGRRTLIAHRCCESCSKRPGERASGARCRRIGSGTLTLLMQWTGEPEFISCVPLLPIRASQSPGATCTPSPRKALRSFWPSEEAATHPRHRHSNFQKWVPIRSRYTNPARPYPGRGNLALRNNLQKDTSVKIPTAKTTRLLVSMNSRKVRCPGDCSG